ncbi:hypothetical protein ColLi_13253 [Colletotrichum liriopes]|uniref:Uncharacterized protein n=1 Tax=Colletotrichum liriopes TaxID=708192 RepID=A0AA37LYJ1_9PEZI|nr:hypothetical protein ColLi_13253 [Colletotrichum liriopes]
MDDDDAFPLPDVANRLRRIINGATLSLEILDAWVKQPGFSVFEHRARRLMPPITREVDYSQSSISIKENGLTKQPNASVSMLVADGDSTSDEPYWALIPEPFDIEGANA